MKKTTQSLANRYARLRDCGGEFGGANCISCGVWKDFSELDGGHFIPTTSSAIRFHEDNIWAQCKKCNLFLHGNPRQYLGRLEKKIGRKRVAYLESQEFVAKKWTREELKEIREYYADKIKSIERGEFPSEGNQGVEVLDMFQDMGETDYVSDPWEEDEADYYRTST